MDDRWLREECLSAMKLAGSVLCCEGTRIIRGFCSRYCLRHVEIYAKVVGRSKYDLGNLS